MGLGVFIQIDIHKLNKLFVCSKLSVFYLVI